MIDMMGVWEILLNSFDPDVRALIVNGLFKPQYFDVDTFAEKFREHQRHRKYRTRSKRWGR